MDIKSRCRAHARLNFHKTNVYYQRQHTYVMYTHTHTHTHTHTWKPNADIVIS